MPLSGNYFDHRAALLAAVGGIENAELGFTAFGFFGVAAINAAAASFSILDTSGNAASIPASSTDPSYITYCSFNLPTGLVADAATRQLKLAPLATTALGANTANSSASPTTPFAYAAESVRSSSVPGTVIAITANTLFSLFSVDNTGLVAAGTVGPAVANTTIFVDCEILYLKRKVAIDPGNAMRSRSQAYIAAGVAAGGL